MDDMDDFGDLYGDLDCHISDKKVADKIEAKPVGVDSPLECESNGKVANFEAKGTTNAEDENNHISDSDDDDDDDDDDFRIVLNEDECPKFQPSSGGITGINEEDECDNVVDHLRGDQLPVTAADELVQGSEARGFGVNGGPRPARHVGSHLAGLTSSARESVSGRGAWDNPLMTSFQGASSYNRDISAAAQTGVTFCLPRYRTIFDINIEAFQQKPWRHRGGDITDYFNFGLDEENWKHYCESLNQFRKQATMSNRFPVYQSSRLNQGERDSSVLESLEKVERGFDMPKGRAIQVEGSLGERVPSTDMARRPRALDSDVVIQINMGDSVEDASDLCKDSLEHAEDHKDASQSTSGNHLNDRVLSPHFDGHIGRQITNSVEHCSTEFNGSNSRITSGKDKSNVDCKKNEEDLIRTDSCMLEVWSDSGDQVPHNGSSSCILQSHSQESKDVFAMGKDIRPMEKTSVKELQDSVESDYYLSYDSISDATEAEQEDNKDVACDRDISSGEDKHFSRTRLRSVAELNVAKNDEQTSSVVHRKQHNDLALLDIRCKARKRKSSYDTNDVRGHTYSYHKTEVSPTYKGRKHTAKNNGEKSFAKDSRKGDCVAHLNRNWDEDCLDQRDCYFSDRCHDDRGRSSLCKYSDRSISKNKSFFKEKDSCLRMAKERGDEHWIRMDPEYDDVIHDYRYRERCVNDMHGRQTDLYDTEELNLDPRFQSHVYPMEGEIRSPKRSKYDRKSSFEKNRLSKYIENQLVSPRYEELNNTDQGGWHDDCSPREHLRISWRSNGRYVNQRGHSDIRDLQFKNKKYGWVDPSIKNHHHLVYEDCLESDIDGYISEDVYCENIVSSIQRRKCNRLSRPNLHADDGARFRHCEQGGLPSPERFLFERRSKHDNFQVSKPSFCGHRLLGGRLLNNARKVRVVGKSDSDAGDHINFVPVMGRHELAAVGCRKAVNKYLNGFKGKLARRYSGVPGEGEKAIGAGYRDNHLKNFRHLRQACKQEEIYPHISKDEGSHTHQTGLKVDRVKDSKSFNSDDHTKILVDELPVSQNVEDNEIEEGELIESDKQDVVLVTKDLNSGKKVDNFQLKDSSRSGKVAGIYDNNRFLATLAKMEKRMERFKEPIASKQGPEKNMNSQVDVSVVSDQIKQQRPTRKRRWGGNYVIHSFG